MPQNKLYCNLHVSIAILLILYSFPYFLCIPLWRIYLQSDSFSQFVKFFIRLMLQANYSLAIVEFCNHHQPLLILIRLTQELIDELKNVVSEPQQGPKRLRLLCSAILREITPTSQLVITNVEPPVEQKNIPILLPLVWVQVSFTGG